MMRKDLDGVVEYCFYWRVSILIDKYTETKRYNKFSEPTDLILESLNESILYYSPKLLNQLKEFDDEVSKYLIGLRGKETGSDMTFIDIDSENPGFLTFIKMDTASKLSGRKKDAMNDIRWPLDEYDSSLIFDHIGKKREGRSSIKIGRFINKISKDKFTPSEIESIVNKFKSKFDSTKEEFILVSGSEIAKYYQRNIISLDNIGSIQNSCMLGKSVDIFKIYTDNPESCSLLVLKSSDKILGRALVWKIHKSDIPAKYFMDRIYYTHEYEIHQFEEYAKKMGWGIRNTSALYLNIKVGNKTYKSPKIVVKVKAKEYKSYPYLDTLNVFDPMRGMLYSDGHNVDNRIVLRNTHGEFTDYRSHVSRLITTFRDYFTA
jgi:hypothetical protein